MPAFHFPQFQHEPFWNYLSRLNAYRAQLNHNFEKWKICEVIVVGLNSEFRGHVEPIYLGGLLGLLTRTQDEIWDFFENLAWDNYEFEQARWTLGYPTHESAFHAHPYHQDFYESSHAYEPPILCDYCKSSDHAAYICPYRDFDANYASMKKRLNELTDKVMEIMKARIPKYSHCFNQNREQCNESDSNLGSLKREVSLSDDFEPSYQSRPHLYDAQPLPNL